MTHVMQAAQHSTIAYQIFDFKQKFLAKGFREGGDSYYGKKGMWAAGVLIKHYSTEEEVRYGESNEKLHVIIDFSDEKVRLLQQVGVVNEGNDGGVQDVEINENMEGVDVQRRERLILMGVRRRERLIMMGVRRRVWVIMMGVRRRERVIMMGVRRREWVIMMGVRRRERVIMMGVRRERMMMMGVKR